MSDVERDNAPPDDGKDGLDDDASFEEEEEGWEELSDEDASHLLRAVELLVPGILRRSVAGLSNLVAGDDVADDIGSGAGGAVDDGEAAGEREVDPSEPADRRRSKDAMGFIMNSAGATRREVLRIISREVRVFLENMDFGGEIAKILTSVSFEVRTEIRFIANDSKLKPEIRNRVKVHSPEDEQDEGLAEESAEAEPAPGSDRKPNRRWVRKKGEE